MDCRCFGIVVKTQGRVMTGADSGATASSMSSEILAAEVRQRTPYRPGHPAASDTISPPTNACHSSAVAPTGIAREQTRIQTGVSQLHRLGR